MTREEIGQGLASLVRNMGAVVKDILARDRMAAAGVLTLAAIVAEQERRLRVLEPCPNALGPHPEHAWLNGVCPRCEARR